MKYKCGMYGGSFNPLHSGHVRCIIEAANQCEDLIIVISEGNNRQEIDRRVRYRWIYQLTKHIGNVRIFMMQDDADSKESYSEEYWMQDAQKVKNFAGKTIDAVFCGNDYDKNSFWVKCYPQATHIFFERNEISSTALRENLYGHWDWIPDVAKPHFVKKVLIIGGESTGKSTLTINLAHAYNTNYVEEVGRELSERSGTDLMMLPEDFTDILLAHKMQERKAIQASNKVVFIDTDCLITKFYIQFLEGNDKARNEALADAIAGLNEYDLVLFLEPDVKFVQDGDRSPIIAANRETYSKKIKALFDARNIAYESIDGDYQQRFLKATKLVNALLKG